ncbi:MAG: hypothetical protein C5S49_07495 [Candidatus Methanogaster sp.]|nr:MAG: hypothetical protein C5S49_07495 [ANME-2 cluster archaeon]
MNTRYVISLIFVGLVLTNCSGCVDRSPDGGQESVPGTQQTPAGDATDATDAGGLTEDEMESFENDLAELEALLGGLDDIDAMDKVNDSTFA